MRLPTLHDMMRRLRHLRARLAARWAPCPICHGSEREMVDFGHGTYRAYETQRAEFYARWESDGQRAT